MGKSSKDKRDAYYRLAKEQGWRARSAFKLLQLDEEFNLFEGVTRVVDLCAAPGSWSQVLSRVLIQGERFGRAGFEDRQEKLRRTVLEKTGAAAKGKGGNSAEGKARSPRTNVKIVAIDLQPMSPLEGITMLRADITHPNTVNRLLEALDPGSTATTATDKSSNLPAQCNPPDRSTSNPNCASPTPATDGIQQPQDAHPVDLILSDGAPDVTGLHDLDIYIQSQLLFSALSLALRVLKPGGTFVAKIFRAQDVDLLYAQLGLVFTSVIVAKPRSSRASSIEAFVVCRGFMPPDGMKDEDGVEGLWTMKEDQGLKRERTKRDKRDLGDGITELELGSESEEEGDVQGVEGGAKRAKGWIAPFLACGDLNAFDADATYALPEGHVTLAPIQPPTAPPYRKAVEERRRESGAYGKTKKTVVGRSNQPEKESENG